ncbi:HAAS signaling domain-containing protein [Pseudonocardia sp. GCM10023141]|uniref:HAAS signaling domain-containing protein n=1 Tax=Pseudonocardia sp. GCM10023141 TaxID=3252653 RepID=UPI003611D889
MTDKAPDNGGNAEMPTDVLRTATDPTAEYLDGVRAELSDLPASEVAEILDDVRSHLADLATELGPDAGTGEFTARLGTPAVYAAELRAAAGYPAAPAGTAPASKPPVGAAAARLGWIALAAATFFLAVGVLGRLPGAFLVALVLAVVGLLLVVRDGPRLPTVAALPEIRGLLGARPASGQPARAVTDFVATLQPAWWVLRAVVAAMLVDRVFGSSRGSWILLLIAALVGIAVSIWLGHRSRSDRRWLWLVVPLNALAVLLLLATIGGGSTLVRFSNSSQVVYSSPSQRGLWIDSEREIKDIRPVDAFGNPLANVYLFDQDGRAIDTAKECTTSSGAAPAGAPYPRGVTEYGYDGSCITLAPGPLVVAVPRPTPTAPTPAAATPAVPTPVVPTTAAAPPR